MNQLIYQEPGKTVERSHQVLIKVEFNATTISTQPTGPRYSGSCKKFVAKGSLKDKLKSFGG
ncbi:MAG: hypothetical protein AAF572_05630 [Cyanobacteria bacterium P01_B01_bin.77]